jgi:hypothetical protein
MLPCIPIRLQMDPSQTKGHQARRKGAQARDAKQHTKQRWKGHRRIGAGFARFGKDAVLHQGLELLEHPRRQLALALHFREIAHLDGPCLEFLPEHIGCHDRILDGVVDPDSSDWRHHVGRIANEQQARTIPLRETRRLDGGRIHPRL